MDITLPFFLRWRCSENPIMNGGRRDKSAPCDKY
jgi:hypothetical protein